MGKCHDFRPDLRFRLPDRPVVGTLHVAVQRFSDEPQQCLYFFPLPQGQRSLRPTFWPEGTRVREGNGSSRPLHV